MSKIKNRKKAVTLAEVLICLAIVGIIAVIIMASSKYIVPDKGESLHKKADYMLEHTISNIVNNENYYPAKDDSSGTTVYGLKNTDIVTEDSIDYEGEEKFCLLMASKFTLYPGTSVDCTSTAEWNFTSLDGIKWKMPISDFSSGDEEIQFRTIDRKSGSDCLYDADSCTDPNLFIYYITPEGKLYKDYATNDKIKPTYD